MKKHVTIAVAVILLAVLACSTAWSQPTREVWLGGYLLLRVRCAAGGYSIDERVNALQLRANNLLQEDKTISLVTVRKSGKDANIYTDDELFMTVTSGDAAANSTTVESLANTWAQRLRTVFPEVSPDKPGVGRPGQEGAPGNAP